ncbi:MAG: hypothetical protein J6M38_05610, partial [Lentisphaeria bacterium]|nr:hypothetical protein [Lentisphaeria bacterium]
MPHHTVCRTYDIYRLWRQFVAGNGKKCGLCTIGNQQEKNLNRMEIMRYDGSLNRHGWKFLESKAGEMVYVPFEGYYESKGGRVQSPIVKLNKKAGEPAYYSVEFKAKAKDHCYWWVDLFDAQGKPLPDINSAVYPTDDEVAYKEMIYVQGKADAMQLAFISKEGVSVQDIVVKKVSAKEAAE